MSKLSVQQAHERILEKIRRSSNIDMPEIQYMPANDSRSAMRYSGKTELGEVLGQELSTDYHKASLNIVLQAIASKEVLKGVALLCPSIARDKASSEVILRYIGWLVAKNERKRARAFIRTSLVPLAKGLDLSEQEWAATTTLYNGALAHSTNIVVSDEDSSPDPLHKRAREEVQSPQFRGKRGRVSSPVAEGSCASPAPADVSCDSVQVDIGHSPTQASADRSWDDSWIPQKAEDASDYANDSPYSPSRLPAVFDQERLLLSPASEADDPVIRAMLIGDGYDTDSGLAHPDASTIGIQSFNLGSPAAQSEDEDDDDCASQTPNASTIGIKSVRSSPPHASDDSMTTSPCPNASTYGLKSFVLGGGESSPAAPAVEDSEESEQEAKHLNSSPIGVRSSSPEDSFFSEPSSASSNTSVLHLPALHLPILSNQPPVAPVVPIPPAILSLIVGGTITTAGDGFVDLNLVRSQHLRVRIPLAAAQRPGHWNLPAESDAMLVREQHVQADTSTAEANLYSRFFEELRSLQQHGLPQSR